MKYINLSCKPKIDMSDKRIDEFDATLSVVVDGERLKQEFIKNMLVRFYIKKIHGKDTT
jgi:hypothetical protein